MMRWQVFSLALGLIALHAGPAQAQPATSVHDLKWFVHVDLITGARPLSFYQDLIAQASLDASDILQGSQGPFDNPCCSALEDVSVAMFGTTGDGLDVIDNSGELSALDSIGLPGQRAFIVTRLNFCSGFGNPIGCADTPSCAASPASQVLVVAMQAHDEFDSFAHTLTHERGHNSCLDHEFSNACELMSPTSGGGCVSSGECAEFVEESTGSSGTCGCYADANTLAADGTTCTEFAGGICSGGLCGEPNGDAAALLFAAAGTSGLTGAPTDDALQMGALTGNWNELGNFSSGREPEGLAFAPERDLLYGVAPSGGSNVLLTINPDTGSTTDIGSVSGVDGGEDLVALAWDPGSAGAGDDRLLALDRDVAGFNDLYEIDPDTGAGTKIGIFNFGGAGGFTGLAYDPGTSTLFASAAFASGLFEVVIPCAGSCTLTEITDPVLAVNKFAPGLAFSAASGSVFHVGDQLGPRIEYDSFDATALAAGTITKRTATRGIDGFTTGGLAALPVPEPSAAAAAVGAFVGLVALRRRRVSR